MIPLNPSVHSTDSLPTAGSSVRASRRSLDDRPERALRVFLKLGRYAKPYAPMLALGLVLLLVDSLFNVFVAWILQAFIDTTNRGSLADLMGLVRFCSAVAAGSLAAMALGHFLRGYGQAKMERDLGVDTFERANRLPLEVVTSKHTGDLAARVTSDVRTASRLLGDNMNDLCANVCTCLTAFIYLAHIQLLMAIVAVAVGPITFLSGRFFDQRMRKISKEVQDKGGDVRGNLQEFLQNMAVARAYGQEEEFTRRYVAQRELQNRFALKQAAVTTTMWNVSGAINNAVGILLMFFVALWALHGAITPGAVLAFFILFNRVQWPFVGLSRTWGGVQQAFGAGVRILQLLRTQGEPLDAGQSSLNSSVQRRGDLAVEVSNVSFDFPNREDAGSIEGSENSSGVREGTAKALFTDLSLCVYPGETVALVGPSGAGKTTLAQLICGLYIPTAGSVRIFGRSTTGDLRELRTDIAYVPQTPYLFTGTIRDNIAHGGEDATEEMITEAAKAAHAHDFIERLEKGYETIIGEHGATLSGGQRQRIAIARAILRDAPLVVLDEATSALDNESERHVQDALQALTQTRTTLIIAHRLSTIRNVDRIVVLSEGRIVEEGTYEILLARKGLFSTLHALQFDTDSRVRDA